METLKLDASVVTTEPAVALDSALAPGSYRVRLVVSGTRGSSLPAEVALTVVPTRRVPPLTPP